MRAHRGTAAGLLLGLVVLLATPPAVPQEYLVSPGDVLEVFVLGEPDLSGSQTVSPDGDITLPLVGHMAVARMTLTAITQKLATALKKYIRNPQVTVSIRQSAARRQFVYLLGEVVHPGAYEMQDGWTVAELVAAAGGPASGAALPRALILRKSATIPVDLEQVLVDGNASADLSLEPGDVVVVPETKNRVVLMGEVVKPGPYTFKPGDRVVDVLSVAGGLTPKASSRDLGVVRQVGGKSKVTPVNLDKFYRNGDLSQNIVVQPGDIVYAPKAGADWGSVLQSISGLTYLILLLK